MCALAFKSYQCTNVALGIKKERIQRALIFRGVSYYDDDYAYN